MSKSQMNYYDYAMKMMFLAESIHSICCFFLFCSFGEGENNCLTTKQMIITMPSDILVSINVSFTIVLFSFPLFLALTFPYFRLWLREKNTQHVQIQIERKKRKWLKNSYRIEMWCCLRKFMVFWVCMSRQSTYITTHRER